MRNIDACLYVRPSDRATLERLVADGKTPQKIVARARIVLLSGCGFGTNAIEREARVSKPTVWRWQKAYMDGGVERLLKDRGKGPRAGKKPISAEVRLAIVTRTAKEKPRHATHWSAHMLAEEIGVAQRNAKPKPFKWTAKANIILEKNARGRRALEEAVSVGIK